MQLFEECFFLYCRWDNGKMNIPHRILTPDDPDTGIPGKYTEVNTSNECVTTPQSSYGDVSTWHPLRQACLFESLYRIQGVPHGTSSLYMHQLPRDLMQYCIVYRQSCSISYCHLVEIVGIIQHFCGVSLVGFITVLKITVQVEHDFHV